MPGEIPNNEREIAESIFMVLRVLRIHYNVCEFFCTIHLIDNGNLVEKGECRSLPGC